MSEGHSGHLSGRGLHLWRGDRCLFRDLSIELESGQLLHVTGSNGSGKTSLLRVLCGLSQPDEGAVRWRGGLIERLETRYPEQLAYLGHLEGSKGDLSALENLRFHFSLRQPLEDGVIEEALVEMGLSRVRSLPVRFLSAGQRRRVALARTILSEVPMWIMDEPYANLDTQGRALVTHKITEHLVAGGLVVMAVHEALTFDIRRIVPLELGE